MGNERVINDPFDFNHEATAQIVPETLSAKEQIVSSNWTSVSCLLISDYRQQLAIKVVSI